MRLERKEGRVGRRVAGPGMLVLTHFYPPVEAVDIRGIVAERYAGPVVLAFDGWSTVIEDR